MKLNDLKPARLSEPLRFLLYGGEGVGKSTVAAEAPRCIMLDLEHGSGQLSIARYPLGPSPTFEEVSSAIDDLRSQPHDFATLAIDTVDALEPLVWDVIVRRFSGKPSPGINPNGRPFSSIEDFGYGKGFSLAIDVWRSFLRQLDALRRSRGMEIILVGHSAIRPFKNPSGLDYDRFALRLHKDASGLVKEWVDIVGYLELEGGAHRGKDEHKAKEFSTGERLIHFQHGPGWDAKTRVPNMSPRELLPSGQSYATIDNAIKTARDGKGEKDK